jgi:hypothetical protein
VVLLPRARRSPTPLFLRLVVVHSRAPHHLHPRRRADHVLLLLRRGRHGAVGPVLARPPSLPFDRRTGDRAGGGAHVAVVGGGGVQQWRVHVELHAGEGAPAADGVEDGGGAHAHVGHGADDGVHPGEVGRRAMLLAAAATTKRPLLLLLPVEGLQVGRRWDEVVLAIHAWICSGTAFPLLFVLV